MRKLKIEADVLELADVVVSVMVSDGALTLYVTANEAAGPIAGEAVELDFFESLCFVPADGPDEAEPLADALEQMASRIRVAAAVGF